MKETDYFQKALTDADYRRGKIIELREHRKLGVFLLSFMIAVAAFGTLYRGIVTGNWIEAFGSIWCSVIIVAWVHTNTKTRLAALEAMEGKAAEPADHPAPQAAH